MARENEFLPAVLAIQENPPSPIGRIIILLIMLLFSATLAWAVVGKTDIVAVAKGKVIPSGHVKTVQSPAMGVVKQLHVAEGQPVRKGELLLELDPEIAAAEVQRLNSETAAAALELKRLKILERQLRGPQGTPMPAFEDELPAVQLQLIRSRWQSHIAQLERLQNERRALRSEQAGALHQVEKLRAVLPIVEQRAEKLKNLAGQKYLSTEQYLGVEQQRLETRHDLAAQQAKAEQLDAEIAQASSRIEHTSREFEYRLLTELVAAEKRLSGLSQELVKARKRASQQQLRAPVSGVVQQLQVHTLGSVITPAQQLMVIVPDHGRLEIVAQVLNKDIGFVDEGQRTEIKFDAFPFTRYGSVRGRVTDIAEDAVEDQRLGLVYEARVRMAQQAIQVDGRMVRISPGMKVAVEIQTGKRRLIEYFLSPLLRYGQESVRER